MPGHRLRVKKLTLIKRTTLHLTIVPTLTEQTRNDTRCSTVS